MNVAPPPVPPISWYACTYLPFPGSTSIRPPVPHSSAPHPSSEDVRFAQSPTRLSRVGSWLSPTPSSHPRTSQIAVAVFRGDQRVGEPHASVMLVPGPRRDHVVGQASVQARAVQTLGLGRSNVFEGRASTGRTSTFTSKLSSAPKSRLPAGSVPDAHEPSSAGPDRRFFNGAGKRRGGADPQPGRQPSRARSRDPRVRQSHRPAHAPRRHDQLAPCRTWEDMQ